MVLASRISSLQRPLSAGSAAILAQRASQHLHSRGIKRERRRIQRLPIADAFVRGLQLSVPARRLLDSKPSNRSRVHCSVSATFESVASQRCLLTQAFHGPASQAQAGEVSAARKPTARQPLVQATRTLAVDSLAPSQLQLADLAGAQASPSVRWSIGSSFSARLTHAPPRTGQSSQPAAGGGLFGNNTATSFGAGLANNNANPNDPVNPNPNCPVPTNGSADAPPNPKDASKILMWKDNRSGTHTGPDGKQTTITGEQLLFDSIVALPMYWHTSPEVIALLPLTGPS